MKKKTTYQHILEHLRTWIPIGIAVFALCVSLNLCTSFNPVTSINGVFLDSINSSDELLFVIPITFFNEGYKSGLIEDIYFIISDENDEDNECRYDVKYEFEIDRLLDDLNIELSNVKSPFLPFSLDKRGEKIKYLFFVNPKSKIKFEAKTYNLDVYLSTRRDKDARFMERFRLKLNPDIMQGLNKGSLVLVRRLGYYDVLAKNEPR